MRPPARATATERSTAAAKKPAPGKRLSDTQVAEVMALLKDVGSVELKLTIPQTDHHATIRGLGIDPVESEPRQVFFFDTPKLDLNTAGIVVRARRSPGGAADTVVKLRPVVPAKLPAGVRHSGSCKVEIDFIPGAFVCSASMKGQATNDEIRDAVDGQIALSKVFTKEQRAFFRSFAPAKMSFEKLLTLGPTFLLRARTYVKRLDRKVTTEYWLYPDGSRILEVSTKAEPKETFQIAAEFRTYLLERGVDLGGEQETKTAAALRYYSAQLRAEKNGKRAPG